MGAHFAKPTPRSRPDRGRQVGVLAIALGVGLLAFAFLDEGNPVRTTSPTVPPSTQATVLGSTVEPEPTLPQAGPAVPAPLETTVADEVVRPSPSSRGTGTTRAPTRPPTTTSTTGGAVLIPPTVVTNTVPESSTTSEPTSSTTEGSTTTEPTTTTSATDAAPTGG